jgi:hypothetical protein
MENCSVKGTERPDAAFKYSTPELFQAAFLLLRGHQITRISHSDRYKFFFERTAELETDLADFRGNGKVGIRDLLSRVYALKRLMKEEDAKR